MRIQEVLSITASIPETEVASGQPIQKGAKTCSSKGLEPKGDGVGAWDRGGDGGGRDGRDGGDEGAGGGWRGEGVEEG